MPPNFGRREQVALHEEDYNMGVEPSARNPRESADLTIDMLTGNKQGMMGRRQPTVEEVVASQMNQGSNMPRN